MHDQLIGLLVPVAIAVWFIMLVSTTTTLRTRTIAPMVLGCWWAFVWASVLVGIAILAVGRG